MLELNNAYNFAISGLSFKYARRLAIISSNSIGVKIERSYFENLGGSGMYFSNALKTNISSSIITNCGCSGIGNSGWNT